MAARILVALAAFTAVVPTAIAAAASAEATTELDFTPIKAEAATELDFTPIKAFLSTKGRANTWISRTSATA